MIKFSILLVLLLCVYFPIIPELVNVWLGDSNNSHGILVPLISGYLVYQRRHYLKIYIADMQNLKYNFWTTSFGLFIFVVSLCIYIPFFVGHIDFVPRVMVIISLISLVWYYFGLGLVKIILFPLLFLFFMVPVPVSLTGYITLPMKTFATNMAVPMIQMFNIPLLQEGNLIHLMTGTIEIAGACSGIRSLVSMLMLGVFFAYMTKKNNFKKVGLVLFSPVIAIFANIMRIVGTGILAHFYGIRMAKGYVHDVSGYLVFILGFSILFLLFILLNRESKLNEPATIH